MRLRHRCGSRGRTRPLLAIVELKRGFNLDLLLQAVDRMRPADEVWLAVPMTRRGRDRDPRVRRLCRLIGLGLLAVDAARDRVEILAEPGPYKPRSDPCRRARLLTEHSRRRGDPSPGGSTREPVMTAYRQRALACAAGLRAGPGRPRDLRAAAPDAGPHSAAQCLWLVRAHRTRPLSSHLPRRSGAAAMASALFWTILRLNWFVSRPRIVAANLHCTCRRGHERLAA